MNPRLMLRVALPPIGTSALTTFVLTDPLVSLADPVDDGLWQVSALLPDLSFCQRAILGLSSPSKACLTVDSTALQSWPGQNRIAAAVYAITYRTPHLAVHYVRVKDEISVFGSRGAVDAVHDVRVSANQGSQ